MHKQVQALADDGTSGDFAVGKRAAIEFYLERIVPEAMGLRAGAMAGADQLYSIADEALLA